VNFEGHDVLSNEDLRSGIEIEIEINLLTKSGPQEGIGASGVPFMKTTIFWSLTRSSMCSLLPVL
jgi:hypothetical protein